MATYNTNNNSTGTDHNHGTHYGSAGTFNYTSGETHDFAAHVDATLGYDVLASGQNQFGGYAYLGESTIIARSPITGLRPVIDQAIRQIVGNQTLEQAANKYGGMDGLESKIANQLTNLNDWGQLQEETQNEIMILTGINFDAMTAAEQEMTINHLLHSPLPFGAIEEVLATNVKIDLGITHTLDKNKTEVEDLGDGIWQITMISNNNNGSHTGHNLGSFKVDLGANADADIAKQIGNSMVSNTNNNNKLYLDQAARDVLRGNTEKMDFDHPEYEEGETPGAGHSFVEHVSHHYGSTVIDGQNETGGYAWLNDTSIVGRSTITGMQPVVEQAIQQVKKANPNLSGEALEQAVAQQITNLNDWQQLTEATQAKIMIETGINFDSMTAAEQEMTINHLLHSPLPFGMIDEVIAQNVKIDLGFTHTLDKDKTTAEHLGDGIYKVNIISNNNNGSHTGHNLGSFKVDLSDEPAPGDFAIDARGSSTYQNNTTYSAANLVGDADAEGPKGYDYWLMSNYDNAGIQTVELDFATEKYASGLNLHKVNGYATGAVKVELQDQDGEWHTVWEGRDAAVAKAEGEQFEIRFDTVDFLSNTARISIDTNTVRGNWELMDAVEFLGEGGEEFDGSGLESKAIEAGNSMVVNTNNNAKLYLDPAARDVLYGNVEADDFDMANPYQKSDNHDGHDHGNETGGETGGETGFEVPNFNLHIVNQHGTHSNHGGQLVTSGNNKFGTGDNDTITGSNADNVLMGGNGNDVLNGLGGNDVLDGEAGEDIAYYEGKLSDYQFQQNTNGLLVKGATTGTDILIDIESLYFAGEDKYYTPAEALEAQDSTDTGTDNGSMNHIHGGAEDDYLEGTDGNDHMMGGAGVDVFRSSAGDDTMVGEAGNYDQIDYEGKVSDYSFTANDDGSVTVTKPNGTDTLSDINGVWFLGEAVWHSMDDLVAGIDDGTDGTDQTGTNEITGTDGEDYLFGTSGDDLIDLGAGLDVVVGSAGNDTINGGDAGYNQVDYLGASSDYTFARNEDGSVTVTKADGTDTLTDIGGVWFGADAVWMSMDELTGSTTGGGTEASAATEGDDYLLGTDGDDVINGLGGVDVIRSSAGNDTIDGGGEEYDQVDYAGSSSDYVFAKNTDGSFTSTASNGDVDLLIDIDGIWFEGDNQWMDIEDAA